MANNSDVRLLDDRVEIEAPGAVTLIGTIKVRKPGKATVEPVPAAVDGVTVAKPTSVTGVLTPANPLPPKIKLPHEYDLTKVLAEIIEEVSHLGNELHKVREQLNRAQPGWRWCRNCEGLFFGERATKGKCPNGGEHTFEGSGHYRVIIG